MMFEKTVAELSEIISLRGLSFGIAGLTTILVLFRLTDCFETDFTASLLWLIKILVFSAIGLCISFVGLSEMTAFFIGGLISLALKDQFDCLLDEIEDLPYAIATWWRNRKGNDKQ